MSQAKKLPRGVHHVAFATRDPKATYDFYHNKLGMSLCHTEHHLQGKGYFKHFFFDMGNDQFMAFFEISGVGEDEDYRTDISTGLGMPVWVNHVAFDAETEEQFEDFKKMLKESDVGPLMEVDHHWCKSVYFGDPNGIMLEYTYTSDPAGFEQTHDEAYDLLFNSDPANIGEDTRKKVNKNV